MSGKKGTPAGSLKSGEPAFLAAGKVRRPHGVRGELFVELYTDYPERLQPGKTVYLGARYQALTIRQARPHQDGLLLGFEGYNTPESAGIFRNQTLYVATAEAPSLEAGEYYFHELLDLAVVDESGTALGSLTEIIETGANDVYVVTTPSGDEILLPAIPQVIRAIDLTAQRMTVHLLPGLLPGTEVEGSDQD
jgi:16S rRNA processing protein RimM